MHKNNMDPVQATKWVDRHEAKDLLKISLRSLDYLREEGRLRSFRVPGTRKILLLREEVEALPKEIPSIASIKNTLE